MIKRYLHLISILSAILAIMLFGLPTKILSEAKQCTGRAYTWAIAWNSKSRHLAINKGRSVYLFDNDLTLINCIEAGDKDDLIYSMAWQPNGNLLAIDFGDRIFLWDDESQKLTLLEDKLCCIVSLAWNPDGTLLAGGTQQKLLYIWNVQTGNLDKTIELYNYPMESIAWHPQKNVIAATHYAEGIVLVDVESGLKLTAFDTWDVSLSVEWSPNGKRAAVGISSNSIYALDTKSGWPIQIFGEDGSTIESYRLPTETAGVFSFVWFPDSRRLAANSLNGTTAILDTYTNKMLFVVDGGLTSGDYLHQHTIALSPDADRLINFNEDNKISVWDTSSGKLIKSFALP